MRAADDFDALSIPGRKRSMASLGQLKDLARASAKGHSACWTLPPPTVSPVVENPIETRWAREGGLASLQCLHVSDTSTAWKAKCKIWQIGLRTTDLALAIPEICTLERTRKFFPHCCETRAGIRDDHA